MNSEKNGGREDRILSRIDGMIEELQLLRREVAQILVERADFQSRAENCETSSMTLEQLYLQDYGHQSNNLSDQDKEEIPIVAEEDESKASEVEVINDEEKPHFDQLFEVTEPQASMNDLFVPFNEDDGIDAVFEKQMSFHVNERFSLADRYFYANELFCGDQVALNEALSDIEKLSSWSQVESYLYDVIRLKREDNVVKSFVEIIKEGGR